MEKGPKAFPAHDQDGAVFGRLELNMIVSLPQRHDSAFHRSSSLKAFTRLYQQGPELGVSSGRNHEFGDDSERFLPLLIRELPPKSTRDCISFPRILDERGDCGHTEIFDPCAGRKPRPVRRRRRVQFWLIR